MILQNISRSVNGINMGLEFSCGCLFLLLLLAMHLKKSTTEEMRYYKYSVLATTIAGWADFLAYLVSGNQNLIAFLMSMSIISYIAAGYGLFLFYTYLKSHYKERYAVPYSNREILFLYIYVIIGSVLYISSIWTKWFYYIDADYVYRLGRYAPATGLFYLPFLLLCFYVAFSNRAIASKRETLIYCGFSCIYIILAYVDARFMTTLIFLAKVIFVFLIYILISVDQEQELERKQTELVKSELNALRLQMNPHFIYNTLASIDGLCMFDPEEARSLIAKFTKHLRGSYLDHSPSTIPFEKELENLESYFAVEQVRFPDIEFVTDIQVTDFEVPPLTVQPVFENAIKHGICGKEEKEGKITLSTYEKDQCYHVVIEDDGVGFDVNQKKEPDGRAHLGVENTRKRLELICGGQMITTSTPGVGTRVDLVIPRKEKKA